MKSLRKVVIVFALSIVSFFTASAQMDLGVDLYSSYVWRGAKFGAGSAFQPYMEYSAGDFAIGAWGSVATGGDEGYEMDLYASYSIGDLSIAVTDYYFGGDWTEAKTMHSIEPALSYSLGDLSMTAAYMLLPELDDDPATLDEDESRDFASKGDMYFELGYSLESFDLTLGAGDGQYTKDADFAICNIAISSSKEVKITEDFSLPVSGSVILNPSTGGFFIVAGISF